MTILADEKLRLLLADDHAGVLEEIRQLLAPEFEIAGAARGGRALLDLAAELRPDAVISDVAMPDLDGIEAGRLILDRGHAAAVVALTMHNDPSLVQRALRAGIRGFILKVDAGAELVAAVRAVARGRTYLSRSVRAA